jgi:hypothetical protein
MVWTLVSLRNSWSSMGSINNPNHLLSSVCTCLVVLGLYLCELAVTFIWSSLQFIFKNIQIHRNNAGFSPRFASRCRQFLLSLRSYLFRCGAHNYDRYLPPHWKLISIQLCDKLYARPPSGTTGLSNWAAHWLVPGLKTLKSKSSQADMSGTWGILVTYLRLRGTSTI